MIQAHSGLAITRWSSLGWDYAHLQQHWRFCERQLPSVVKPTGTEQLKHGSFGIPEIWFRQTLVDGATRSARVASADSIGLGEPHSDQSFVENEPHDL